MPTFSRNRFLDNAIGLASRRSPAGGPNHNPIAARLRARVETTASDGKTSQTRFHSLGATIAVGYRVSSCQSTQFRAWATPSLREFIIKGFIFDDGVFSGTIWLDMGTKPENLSVPRSNPPRISSRAAPTRSDPSETEGP